MAVAWIQWNDPRRAPAPINVDLGRREEREDGSDGPDDNDSSVHDDSDSPDEDRPLYTPLEKSTLSRSGSVGNSWGITAVGRGFDWRWKQDIVESEDKPPVKTEIAAELPKANQSTLSKAPIEGKPPSLVMMQVNGVSTSGGHALIESLNDPLLPNSGEPRTVDNMPSNDPSLRPQLAESTPPTPPDSPKLMTTHSPTPRPNLAGRSQSMFVLPTTAMTPVEDLSSLPRRSSPNASPSLQAQRAKAWSRPVSPSRSPTLSPLNTSPSAPSLNPLARSFSAMTPLVITAGALTTPNTPRSPRLNRSRASQKRVSLVAGRQVAGLSVVGTDSEADAAADWVTFGRSASPTEDDNDEVYSGPEDNKSDIWGDFSRSRKASRSHSRGEIPAVEPEEDWHIGRAGQIKSLGGLHSSLGGPPTPLRAASYVGTPLSPQPPTIQTEYVSTGDISALRSSKSIISLAPQDDLHVPVEEEKPNYPPLDILPPDWSLQRLSSSWSLSSSSHQRQPSTASRRDRSVASQGRSVSTDGRDDIITMMKRMKSSTSIKRMSSESGRRGGYLGGKTIDDYVIVSEAGRGAYGLVKRARERKKPLIGIDDNGLEVVLEDVKPDETIGPPLIIKQIIKSRILADCWKKHPIHGTIPIEIYVMSALSGTSYVLPKPRAWDPRRFEDDEDDLTLTDNSVVSSQTATPGAQTPNGMTDVKIQITSMTPVRADMDADGEEEEVTELDRWRWREGELIKGHPNICPLEEFFEDASFYYLVLPATKPSFPKMPKGMEDAVELGGRKPPNDLFDLVEMYPSGLPGPLIRSYLGQIADALSFLHARGICHRDVKDENVVLGENGRCWLIDFGSSGVIRKNGWDSFSGTLDYAAPEILGGARYAGPPQDVWAYGIVAYVLLVGECPFASSAESAEGLEDPEGKPALGLRARCSAGPAGFDEGLEKDGGGRLGDAMELVRRCLELDVNLRPTMEQILACRYLNGGSGWGQDLTPASATLDCDPPS